MNFNKFLFQYLVLLQIVLCSKFLRCWLFQIVLFVGCGKSCYGQVYGIWKFSRSDFCFVVVVFWFLQIWYGSYFFIYLIKRMLGNCVVCFVGWWLYYVLGCVCGFIQSFCFFFFIVSCIQMRQLQYQVFFIFYCLFLF